MTLRVEHVSAAGRRRHKALAASSTDKATLSSRHEVSFHATTDDGAAIEVTLSRFAIENACDVLGVRWDRNG